MLTEYLTRLLEGCDLDSSAAEKMLEEMTSPGASRIQSAAILTALRMKTVSCSELAGGARMLRRHAHRIDCGGRAVSDIVGTGGDGGRSFNISTASAFVAAGAGCAVAKHGNRAVSGKCGSADVLEALGVDLNAAPETMEECIRNHGIGFLFARTLHPAMGAVAELRRELGFRTIFNLLGPLANPAGAAYLVTGVYDSALTEPFARVLGELGAKHVLAVHGRDGLDEISVSAPTRVAEWDGSGLRTFELYPEMLTGESYAPEEIAGGDAACNAKILLGILEGSLRGAPRSAVLVNAGAAIYVSGRAGSLKEGIVLAGKSVDSGAALEKLRILIRESQRTESENGKYS